MGSTKGGFQLTSSMVRGTAVVATLLLGVFAVVNFLPEAHSSRRPNVILITTS